MTVWTYVNTSKQIGDKDDLKVFAAEDAANRRFAEHDPKGVAFAYPVASAERPGRRTMGANPLTVGWDPRIEIKRFGEARSLIWGPFRVRRIGVESNCRLRFATAACVGN